MISKANSQPIVLDAEDLNIAVPIDRDLSIPGYGSVTYRSYLKAIEVFILENLEGLEEVVRQKFPDSNGEIRSIDLVAEKRGADYFPASVRIRTGMEVLWFVANVALTDRGISRIRRDYDFMSFLGLKDNRRFVPEVYFMSDSSDASSSVTEKPNLMFLAEWLRGYHEFHVSEITTGEKTILTLWDDDNGYSPIPNDLALKVIEKVAYILTHYFDLESFREIYPWHLAAGDFIAKLYPAPDSKLITVRQYDNRIVFADCNPDNLTDALLMFLANITVRARLDRIDGTGDFVWLGDEFLDAIIVGFHKALIEKTSPDSDMRKLLSNFFKVTRSKTLPEWTHVFVELIASYDDKAPDYKIISQNLVEHIFCIHKKWQSLSFADGIMSFEELQA